MEDAFPFSGAYAYYKQYRPGIPVRVVELLVSETGTTPEHRVLDIGCGTGQMALALDGRCREIVCVDADAHMVALASEATRALRSKMRVACLHAAA